MTIYGLDVSHYQGPIDWRAVAGHGVSFATIKMQGSYEAQNGTATGYFKREFPKAAQALPVVGGYAWVQSGAIPRQVDYVLDTWDSVGGYDGRIVQLDWEPNPKGYEASWEQGLAWLEEWRRQTNGYPVIVYIPRWFVNNKGWGTKKLPAWTHVWSSHYTGYSDTGPGWQPYLGKTPLVWQYTDSARVRGVNTPVDRNGFRGTVEDLRNKLTKGGVTVASENEQKLADAAWGAGVRLDRVERQVNAIKAEQDQLKQLLREILNRVES